MIAIRESLTAHWATLVAEDKDHSLFGSLGIVAACLICLALVFVTG